MEKFSLSAFQEYSEEKFTKRVIRKGENTAFVLNFMPGQQLPDHKNPGTEVYLYALTGTGTIVIDGNETEMAAGDLVHTSGEESLAFRNTGSDPVGLYVVLTKLPGEEYAKNI